MYKHLTNFHFRSHDSNRTINASNVCADCLGRYITWLI